jgi:hypothetical protein
MFNEASIKSESCEMDRNAYNAALYELGFKWHLDIDAYDRMVRHSSDAFEQLRHHLETQQPHLLRAYDPTFLIHLILTKKAAHWARAAQSGGARAINFDWARNAEHKIGF